MRGEGQFRKRTGWKQTKAVETLRRAVLPLTSDLLPYRIQAPKTNGYGPGVVQSMSADSIEVYLKCPRLETDSWEAVASFLFPKQNCEDEEA